MTLQQARRRAKKLLVESTKLNTKGARLHAEGDKYYEKADEKIRQWCEIRRNYFLNTGAKDA